MAKEPKPAKQKRPDPGQRRNAQGEHEGSAHSPDQLDVMNPEKQGMSVGKPTRRPKAPSDER